MADAQDIEYGHETAVAYFIILSKVIILMLFDEKKSMSFDMSKISFWSIELLNVVALTDFAKS